MTMQAERSSGSSQGSMGTQNVDTSVHALDGRSIKSILLPNGWQSVQNAELVQFTIGTAHSPISPFLLEPTLRYQNSRGNEVFVPYRQILGFSQEEIDTGSKNQ